MERPEQKSDSLRVLPVLADATSSSKNKTAIRGAKRRNNKGQVVREKVALPLSILYLSLFPLLPRRKRAKLFIWYTRSGKNQRNSQRNPPSEVMLYSWGPLNALAHPRYVFITVTPRYVKSTSVFRESCWLIMAAGDDNETFSLRNISRSASSIEMKERNGNGTKEGKNSRLQIES